MYSYKNFDLLASVAMDFYGYPIDGTLDIVCAIDDYLWNGQEELDELIDEIHMGIANPQEVLKFNNIQGINFTN